LTRSGGARAAATTKRALDSEGLGLAAADLQIAGIRLSRSSALRTRNRLRFELVQGSSLA
jgi:predicted nucleic acid-binding protein